MTNRRVIQAEGIINKHVIDSSLEKVNDVVLDQSFLGRMFDYGNIEILTASEGGVNKLDKIPSPVQFKTEMLNQKQGMGMDDLAGARGPGHNDIPALIAELDALRQRGILTDAEFQQKKAELLSDASAEDSQGDPGLKRSRRADPLAKPKLTPAEFVEDDEGKKNDHDQEDGVFHIGQELRDLKFLRRDLMDELLEKSERT